MGRFPPLPPPLPPIEIRNAIIQMKNIERAALRGSTATSIEQITDAIVSIEYFVKLAKQPSND